MRYKSLTAVAVILTLFVADAAAAQDGGIWVSRPRPRRTAQESVPASALPGLVPGLPVQNRSGKEIGRVSKIVTTSDGSIRKVVAISTAGNFLNLSPSSLSVTNGIVTTDSE